MRIFLTASAVVLVSVASANAHVVKNSGGERALVSFPYRMLISDPLQGGPIGQPKEAGQAAERDVHGAPHGSSSNPSPHR